MIDPAHLTDAELAAWYGSGLHAPKAQRLIEEVRRLRARLAEVETLLLQAVARALEAEVRAEAAESRLAEVEAERDQERRWKWQERDLRKAAEARLTAVLALCAEARSGAFDSRVSFESAVRAAARGEGDQPAEECAHCGRRMGDYNGGSSSMTIGDTTYPLCHPNAEDRPDCYHLVTVMKEPLGSRGEGDRPAPMSDAEARELLGGLAVYGEGDQPAEVDRTMQYIAERDAELLRRLGEGDRG